MALKCGRPIVTVEWVMVLVISLQAVITPCLTDQVIRNKSPHEINLQGSFNQSNTTSPGKEQMFACETLHGTAHFRSRRSTDRREEAAENPGDDSWEPQKMGRERPQKTGREDLMLEAEEIHHPGLESQGVRLTRYKTRRSAPQDGDSREDNNTKTTTLREGRPQVRSSQGPPRGRPSQGPPVRRQGRRQTDSSDHDSNKPLAERRKRMMTMMGSKVVKMNNSKGKAKFNKKVKYGDDPVKETQNAKYHYGYHDETSVLLWWFWRRRHCGVW
ncbi:hypothetical protein Pmani_038105 [Petrolisthes manimaculis]|uniref:Uncharacterized protein n=1 Tax=Petrolisthes manimaculis TaxID=1843537 RepID=A0AAE1NFI0_9EUCA|nr:hypothetical protein Pmani_038105 [Petrolisthes manimaculis]